MPPPESAVEAPAAPSRRWVDRVDAWRRRLAPEAAPPAAPPGGAWFRALFEHSPDALLVIDAHDRVCDANVVAATLFGRALAELRGLPVTALLRQDDDAGAARLRNGEALVRRAGGACAVELRVQPVQAPEGPHAILHLRAHRIIQERLSVLANDDSLTGLPNRALFRDRLAQAMARAQRSGRPMALMFIDLDRFKLVNDSLGHEVGDRLLQHVARTLTQCLRSVDSVLRLVDVESPFTLSRLGGDEFTVILEAIESAEDAAAVARRILEALHEPFRVGDEEIVVAGSIGISMFPTDDVDLDKLVRHADMAMYRSKSLGRGTYGFFSDDLNAAVSARLSLEGSLRRAIERQEFLLHFQPKADLRTGEVCSVEALLRWHRPGHGLVPPDRFIGVLEDPGMILPVGAWVIRAAIEQLARWDLARLPPLRMAVNLSTRQFRHLHLTSLVEDSLRENAIDPARLAIELTESLPMEDTEGTRATLESFARIGVRLAIDDFGTGHSSLAYLKRFHIDTLKIDRSFVRSLPDDADDVAIAAAVIALGRSMRMKVVVEGVETAAQAEWLRDLGCDEMQGFLLGRPMPAAEFLAWYEPVARAQRQRRPAFGQCTGTLPLIDLGG